MSVPFHASFCSYALHDMKLVYKFDCTPQLSFSHRHACTPRGGPPHLTMPRGWQAPRAWSYLRGIRSGSRRLLTVATLALQRTTQLMFRPRHGMLALFSLVTSLHPWKWSLTFARTWRASCPPK